MRKGVIFVAVFVVVVFVLGSMLSLQASTLAGITMPETVQVGSTPLVLNGMGLRTKFMVKVYVAGLYLPQKSSDAGAILKGDAPKRMVMHFVHGASKSQMSASVASACACTGGCDDDSAIASWACSSASVRCPAMARIAAR